MINIRLLAAYKNAKNPGWYAGEGEPVSIDAFAEAARFLELLPDDWAPTDVYAEPDGDLALEWYFSRDRLLVVSFDGTKSAIWVLRLPANSQATGSPDSERAAGRVPFLGEIPGTILAHLERLFSHAR